MQRIAANCGKAKSHKTAFRCERRLSVRMFNAVVVEAQGLIDRTRVILKVVRKDLIKGVLLVERLPTRRRAQLDEIDADRLHVKAQRAGKPRRTAHQNCMRPARLKLTSSPVRQVPRRLSTFPCEARITPPILALTHIFEVLLL